MSRQVGSVTISVLTVFHNDWATVDHYSAGLHTLQDSHECAIEVLFYFWDCEENFINAVLDGVPSTFRVAYWHGPNLGFAEANNQLAAASTGQILFFLNPDAWFKACAADVLTAQVPEFGILAICQDVGPQDNFFTFDGSLSSDFWFQSQESRDQKRLFADGAAFAVTKSWWDFIGGFDSNLFVFLEDLDFGLRSLLGGGSLISTSDIRVHHLSGGTVVGGISPNQSVHQTSRFRRQLVERNSRYLGRKHFRHHWWYPLWLASWWLQAAATATVFAFAGQKTLALTPWHGAREAKRMPQPAGSRTTSPVGLLRLGFGWRPSRMLVLWRLGVPRQPGSSYDRSPDP